MVNLEMSPCTCRQVSTYFLLLAKAHTSTAWVMFLIILMIASFRWQRSCLFILKFYCFPQIKIRGTEVSALSNQSSTEHIAQEHHGDISHVHWNNIPQDVLTGNIILNLKCFILFVVLTRKVDGVAIT
jgi:hypothetical protein